MTKKNTLLVFLLFSWFTLPLGAQEIYQKWLSSVDGAIREFEFRADSSLMIIRKVDILEPREYYGGQQRFSWEILSQDQDMMRMRMKSLDRENYIFVQLFDITPEHMRMFVNSNLSSPEEAETYSPPAGWGVRTYSNQGLAALKKGQSPSLMNAQDYIDILKDARQVAETLIPDSIPSELQPARPLYLGSRLYDTIAERGFNIFDIEALNQVLLNFLETEEIEALYAEFFKLTTGRDWD